MALSEMTRKEKVVVAVLGVVILAALVGIGVLVAKLLTDEGPVDTSGGGITMPPPTEPPVSLPTITIVANPPLGDPAPAPPALTSREPVARVASPAPLLPAVLLAQPLRAGRRYRVEITAANGSKVRIWGSWSQTAANAQGEMVMPLPETIDATTPFRVNLVQPMANPTSWNCSVSASPKDLLGNPPGLVITIWDVTTSK